MGVYHKDLTTTNKKWIISELESIGFRKSSQSSDMNLYIGGYTLIYSEDRWYLNSHWNETLELIGPFAPSSLEHCLDLIKFLGKY